LVQVVHPGASFLRVPEIGRAVHYYLKRKVRWAGSLGLGAVAHADTKKVVVSRNFQGER
jgi:hypothetical protein